jgi:IS5 family transposase
VKQVGIFDETIALERLSKLGDNLEWLDEVMEWKIFRPLLDTYKPDLTKTEKGGRPPIGNLLMFKGIVLQHLYGISDDSLEFQINDRLTWKRFLGLGLADKAPDSKTFWEFKEILKNTGAYDDLFLLFNAKMEELNVITHKGSMVDASFVDAPRQRNTREENKAIKDGEMPEGWDSPENVNMLEQKDLDAAWSKKNDELHYGYKDHVLVDKDSKMIVDYRVSAANVHDSKYLLVLMNEMLNELWADSAYMSATTLAFFAEHYPEVKIHINEKGYKNNPLTDEQKLKNREKSSVRARIEHIFGHITNSMGGMFIRCIGIERAECAIALKNLVYNISRYATLVRLKRAPKMA